MCECPKCGEEGIKLVVLVDPVLWEDGQLFDIKLPDDMSNILNKAYCPNCGYRGNLHGY